MGRPASVLSLLLTVAAACASSPARDPAVVQDTLEYVAMIKQWERVEIEALTAMRQVQRSQYVDDDFVVATLGKVMDDVELHLIEIEAYQPRTRPVLDVHRRYQAAWSDLHDAFALVIETMERKDYIALAKGTEAMKRSRNDLITVAAALNLLLKETGLKEAEEEPRTSEGAARPASRDARYAARGRAPGVEDRV